MPPLSQRGRKDDVKALASNMHSNDDTGFKARDAIVWRSKKLRKIQKNCDICFTKTLYEKFETYESHDDS